MACTCFRAQVPFSLQQFRLLAVALLDMLATSRRGPIEARTFRRPVTPVTAQLSGIKLRSTREVSPHPGQTMERLQLLGEL